MKWTNELKLKLAELFPTADKKTLLREFPAKIGAIDRKAYCLGLRRNKRRNVTSTLEFLLEDTALTYYWLGFLMADGHFSKKNELRLGLSIKDEAHLRIFAKLINKNLHKTIEKKGLLYVYVSAMDNVIVPKIKEKFDINNRKTYIPPKLEIFEKMTDDLFLSFFIGYVDGDGNVKHQTGRKDWVIQLGCHSSWKLIYKYFLKRLNRIFKCNSHTKIFLDKRRLLRLFISTGVIIRGLKQKCIELKLSFLNRKWDKVDENYVFSEEKFNKIEDKIKEFIKLGLSRKEMSERLGYNQVSMDTFMLHRGLNFKSFGLRSPVCKKINQLDENKKIIKTWESGTDAANFLGLKSSSSISQAIDKKYKAAEFYWEYA